MVSVAKTIFLSIVSLLAGLTIGWVLLNFHVFVLLFLFITCVPFAFFLLHKWKYELGLSEKQVLFLMFSLMFISALLPVVLSGIVMDVTNYLRPHVESYTLNINLLSDKALVTESLVYYVPPGIKGHEFYRSYYKRGPLNDMRVLDISCPKGFINKTYEKTHKIELACRKYKITQGVYNVTFKYEIPKPYVCYETFCFFDWNVLTEFSLDIMNAKVHVSGAKQVWGYPPIDSSFNIPAKTLLEVKAIKPKNEVTSYWMERKEPELVFFINEVPVHIAGFFYKHGIVFLAAVLLVIFSGLCLIYTVFGREYQVHGVPDVLHYPPTKRKPYDVNRIVFKDPNKIEFEGIQATLLDLARRGWLEIKKGKIYFRKGADGLDPYEKKVYETYKWFDIRGEGQVDIKKLQREILNSTDLIWLINIRKRFEELKIYKGENIFSIKGKIIAFFWLLICSLILLLFNHLMQGWLSFSLQSSLWVGIVSLLLIDAYCFGRYKPDIYKEVKLWRAFGRLLEHYSLIKKYAPQDVLMWGEWLIYATALGKAKNVIKAMKEFNIQIPYIDYETYYYAAPLVIYNSASNRYLALAKSSTWGSGGGWSGGGGFGGGFGGGGGGFR